LDDAPIRLESTNASLERLGDCRRSWGLRELKNSSDSKGYYIDNVVSQAYAPKPGYFEMMRDCLKPGEFARCGR